MNVHDAAITPREHYESMRCRRNLKCVLIIVIKLCLRGTRTPVLHVRYILHVRLHARSAVAPLAHVACTERPVAASEATRAQRLFDSFCGR